jgi:urease gamma subunit
MDPMQQHQVKLADPEYVAMVEERRKRREAKLADPEYVAMVEERRKRREAERADPDYASKVEERKRMRIGRRAKYEMLKSTWSATIPEGVSEIIVDGNNMRGGGPDRLTRDQVIAAASHMGATVVIFDHYPATFTAIEGVAVQFSMDRIADDVIVDMATSKSLVVTSDRLLAIKLLEQGAKVMRCKTFLSLKNSS